METTTTTPAVEATRVRLERPTSGRVLAGVSAGIANHTGMAVGLVRLLFLASLLFGGLGVFLYAAGWVLIPAEGADDTLASTWTRDLNTPGKRTGAFLIGIAALILITAAAPVTILAAFLLLVGVVMLSPTETTTPAATPAAVTDDTTPETTNEEQE
jgi:phage shock protein PspC (stress-responsive transcriptional regulator)